MVDKSALLARAKEDPVAFREETAKALDAIGWEASGALARGGLAPIGTILDAPRIAIKSGDAMRQHHAALAHVEALAEAMGALEGS